MKKRFNLSIHRSSSTSYMLKRVGGAGNVQDIMNHGTIGNWTYYVITLHDPNLIKPFNGRFMRIQPI